MTNCQIVRNADGVSKEDAKRLLATGLLRAINRHGKGGKLILAAAADCTPRTIEKALALETLPELDKAGNMLRACPNVLDEFFAALGFRVVPHEHDTEADLDLVHALGNLAGALAKSRSPNSPGGEARVHTETLEVADLARRVVPLLTAIIHDADGLRSAA